MAAGAGRRVRVKYNSGSGLAVIAGARTDSMTISNTPIDITDKDDAGVRTLLDDIGTQSMSMNVEGVLIDGTLLALAEGATAGSALHDFSLDIATIGEITGSFFISNFEVSGADGDEPNTFTCTLESGGALTYTAD